MGGEFLYRTHEGVIGLVLLGLLLAATEVGFRLGRAAPRQEEATRSQISNIQTAILAVLGLLLGFTVSMAVSRFENRQKLVVEESNAIGTAYLRTQLVPGAEGAEMANLLREYVNARLESSSAGADQKHAEQARTRAGQLQDECWSRAVAFAQKEPRPLTAGLLLDSLNQMIDLESTRATAAANHVPETVIYVVALVSLFASVMVGYCYGTGKIRHTFSTTLLALAIVVVLLVILDLDRPREGLIRVNQRAMLQLRDRMHATSH
jgi:uncharacterized membrane protein YsdA (DUF1294 family)